MTDRWEAVICAESAHIHVDECGAPEKVGGLKLLTVPTPDGKLTPELVDLQAWGYGDQHRAQPKVVSITQSTELGTCYTRRGDRGDLRPRARARHGRPPRRRPDRQRRRVARTCRCGRSPPTSGVDVVSFGGTKNGLMLGECVVVLNPAAVRGVDFLRKSAMQLASKMRFVSAQFDALLAGDLWLRNAGHANAMARRLEAAVRDIPGVAMQRPVQANAVFVVLPPAVTERLQKQFPFYVWDEQTGEVRWMTLLRHHRAGRRRASPRPSPPRWAPA